MHLQTINDVVKDLEEVIDQFEFKSVVLLRPALEQLIPQKQMQQARKINDLDQLVGLISQNHLNLQKELQGFRTELD